MKLERIIVYTCLQSAVNTIDSNAHKRNSKRNRVIALTHKKKKESTSILRQKSQC